MQNTAKVLPTETPAVDQGALVKQRFDQAIERAAAALRELSAAAAGASINVDLRDAADTLGHLKAQAATIEAVQDLFKNALIQSGEKSVDGELFKATVSRFMRNTLDMEAVRAKLSDQFIRAHTTQSPVTQVKVSARTIL